MSKGNEPAYPVESFNKLTNGITKRELFAAMAMQGLSANRDISDESVELIAMWAVEQADALLAELERSA